MTKKTELFSYVDPFNQNYLPKHGLHTVYFEEYGNPAGVPLLFLHGGPGGAMLGDRLDYVQLFDTSHYRFIYLHQRGSGRSTPLGEVRENTTWNLVDDIEQLRTHLGIEQWIVAGGSWGATLTLAYAEEHPDRCLGIFVRGIFLGRRHDLDWFFSAGKAVFPDVWDTFVGYLPEDEREDFFDGFAKRILSPDREIYLPACQAWAAYELSCFKIIPDPEAIAASTAESFCVPYARMNIHYFSNGCFLDEKPLLDNIDRIRNLPCFIMHGRYDLSVPLRQARDLAKALPSAEFVIVPDSGHASMDPANARAGLEIQEKMKAWG
jgi:proline iminopeptidase